MLRRMLIPLVLACCFVAAPFTGRPPSAWADTTVDAGAGSGAAATIPPPPVEPGSAATAPEPVKAPAVTPAPVMAEPSRVIELWRDGSFTPALILGLFLATMWLSQHVTALQKGRSAAIVAALLSGCTMLVERAAAGTTPNLSMIATAIGASVLLFMHPKKTDPPLPS